MEAGAATGDGYVVVGAGAIGGTIAAQLVRDGHRVLVCDADQEHVRAINKHGIAIEGPLESFTAPARAVTPRELPDGLGAVILAVKGHHTRAAVAEIAPRLRADGFVASFQNGLNEDAIAEAVGPERVVGAFVNFGADVVAPGRIHLGGHGTIRIGELDGRPSERVRALAGAVPGAQATDNVLGYLWSKQAYGAMLFATAVSDLSIADALAEPAFRPLFVALAREVLDQAAARPEPFDGFDPADLDGSIERLVEFNRRSAKTHSGVYRDLAVRRRPTEVDAVLGPLGGDLVALTRELVHAIERGERRCQRANLELLAAHERLRRLGTPLNAVVAPLGVEERAVEGPLLGVCVAVKDNMDVRGSVTTSASAVPPPPPAQTDAPAVARVRAAAGELLCKANLLEFAAGHVNPAYGMTRNPHDPERTSGGSSGGPAALVAAGVCPAGLGTDTGGSIRVPAAYCGIVGLKPTAGLVPLDGVFPLSPTCDSLGPLAADAATAAALLAALSRAPCPLAAPASLRLGVLTRQLDDPDLQPGVRAAVLAALERFRAAGAELVELDVPELAEAGDALGAIVLREAHAVHVETLAHHAERLGPGTRALLEAGAAVDEAAYSRAMDARARLQEGFRRAFAEVDALAGPTVPYVAPFEDPPFGAPEGDLEARYTGPANLAGTPALSLPCGTAEQGLPAAVQLQAAWGGDALVLSLAHAYERSAT
jgi:2-dehydropantoate 2-reductase